MCPIFIIHNMTEFDAVIFGKKTFSDVLKDIYNNSRKTEQQVMDLITSLKPFITSAGEAVMIVPLIREYLDVKVKNDEHLIKMAAIVQRATQATQMASVRASGNNGDLDLPQAELEALLAEVKLVGEATVLTQEELKQLQAPDEK